MRKDIWKDQFGSDSLSTSIYFILLHFMPILPWCMCKMWFGWRVTDLRRRRMLAGSGIQTAMSRLGCGKWWNVDVEDVELCRILGQMHGMLPEHTTGKKTLAPIGANKCSCKWVWSCWAVTRWDHFWTPLLSIISSICLDTRVAIHRASSHRLMAMWDESWWIRSCLPRGLKRKHNCLTRGWIV